MEHCRGCGEPLPPRSEMETTARYAMEAMFHATRGNREACIRDLKRALRIVEAFHAKIEGTCYTPPAEE